MTSPMSEIVINYACVRERLGMDIFFYRCAELGLKNVSIWGDETARLGFDRTDALLKETGLSVLGYNRAGPLVAGDEAGRASLEENARREIEIAAALGADHVMVFTGGLAQGSRDLAEARVEVAESITRLAAFAGEAGVKLALEPLHPMLAGDRTVLCTMTEANDLCDQLGQGVGLVIDAYHVWWDREVWAQIARAGRRDRILGFHVNDWLIPTKDVLRDRGMMGDGVIDLPALERAVRQAGYRGPVEVEIFSDYWWSQDSELVMRTAMRRCREIFGLDPARSGLSPV
ncbi:sugar phosphate isomerase/epimerase family protein [Pseudohoeflea coraliihabitans]|uniref:Sugar phosphate isomerase/epimerase n=1 Tax=Pseudohoeflea coraliihabitans TaxID=2860393 RepID=A0ABS6WJB7_9HYPH|nr:sugar phosphate isomerase/epimerase family protein [Pseudohoeflea sp. DP4N28-3]MBW3096039.1 sugar phosphate isomerase/epimerase [Pseudohoeflea sp. DP4N28-3]